MSKPILNKIAAMHARGIDSTKNLNPNKIAKSVKP